jgi:ABC-type phosphate/phosphonate transport system substrate-binding protein
LRLYKVHTGALDALVAREVDFAQLNARQFLRARERDPQIRALIQILPMAGFGDGAVIFARKDSGAQSLSDLEGKSFLFGAADSTMTFWTKASLAEAGVTRGDLLMYRYVDGALDILPDHSTKPAVPLGNAFSSMTPADAVARGTYHAGVVRERRFREVATELQLMALAKFSDTADVLVARGNLPPETASAFQRLMLNVKESTLNQPLLNAPARFKAAVNSDFDLMLQKLPAEAAFEK